MVNHVRTHLLNMAPATGQPPPGEEFVPVTYEPLNLPQTLREARNSLFGVGADRVGVNINLARLLAYLHTSELAADVTLADPRITYNPIQPAGVITPGATFDTYTGDDPIGWQGSPTFTTTSRGYGRWVVTTDGVGGYDVAPQAGTEYSGTVTTTTAGDVVPLSDSRLSLVVPENAEGVWAVTLVIPPVYNFSRAVDFGVADQIFSPDRSAAETRWKAVWGGINPAPLRACALALALAERISELRTEA